MPDARRRNPYVFAVGCPRSGTTLLQRMLDRHPQLTLANDTHFIPRALGAAAHDNPPVTPALVAAVRGYHRFHRLGVTDDAVDMAARGAADYREFVEALYDRLAEEHGTPLAGEKTPDYVRHLPLLARLFPWTRVVHIVRDGRDVALSTLSWAAPGKGPGRFNMWQDDPVAVCALWWKWQVSTGIRDKNALTPGRYSDIRYERLVSHPEDAVQELAAFLELDDGREMLRFYEGRRRDRDGLSAKKAWLPPTPGLRSWKTQMQPDDVALFEALAGDLLEALGYELSGDVSPAIAERAERCRQRWDAELAEREGSTAS